MSSTMLLRRYMLPWVRQVANTSFLRSPQAISVLPLKPRIHHSSPGIQTRGTQTTTTNNLEKDNQDTKDGKTSEPKSNESEADRVKRELEALPPSFMLPDLHDKVVAQLTADGVSSIPGFDPEGTAEKSTKAYNTRVMGDFWCTNTDCKKYWSSKVVGIEILKFGPDNTYNATIFNQRCKACNTLGHFRVNENSYVARVVYRLKKWAGIKVGKQPYNGYRRGPVHVSELCEGCKVKKCKYAINDVEN